MKYIENAVKHDLLIQKLLNYVAVSQLGINPNNRTPSKFESCELTNMQFGKLFNERSKKPSIKIYEDVEIELTETGRALYKGLLRIDFFIDFSKLEPALNAANANTKKRDLITLILIFLIGNKGLKTNLMLDKTGRSYHFGLLSITFNKLFRNSVSFLDAYSRLKNEKNPIVIVDIKRRLPHMLTFISGDSRNLKLLMTNTDFYQELSNRKSERKRLKLQFICLLNGISLKIALEKGVCLNTDEYEKISRIISKKMRRSKKMTAGLSNQHFTIKSKYLTVKRKDLVKKDYKLLAALGSFTESMIISSCIQELQDRKFKSQSIHDCVILEESNVGILKDVFQKVVIDFLKRNILNTFPDLDKKEAYARNLRTKQFLNRNPTFDATRLLLTVERTKDWP